MNLLNQLEKAGIENGDVLLVHSSLKKLLTNYKLTIKEIFNTLHQAIGEKGTLLLPLFNFSLSKTLTFDIRNTPSEMGILTEFSRSLPNSIRSGNPFYSFSVTGWLQKEFDVDNRNGFGIDSPFAKFKELNGKIAVIALPDQLSMTCLHFVEEQLQVPYRFYKKFIFDYTDWHGQTTKKEYFLYCRKENTITDVTELMPYLWEDGSYKGEKYNEGAGIRTITFRELEKQIGWIIKTGQAKKYLYREKTD